MQKHPFTIYQLFHLKQKTLEKRIAAYYQASNDAKTVIKLIRLLQIRGELGTEAIDTPCFELIRTLYIQQTSRHLKRYFFYFRTYFSQAEWETLLLRFFPEIPAIKVWRESLTLTLCTVVFHQFTVP